MRAYERFLTYAKIHTQSSEDTGVTPSTVYSMLNPARQQVSITTIKKLCDGLDITLGQFFTCPLFDDLEQELR